VPVLLLYWTAQPRPDGQVIFRNDVYGRDPATLAALDSAFRAPLNHGQKKPAGACARRRSIFHAGGKRG
jgi:hypothetical protein